MNLDPHWLKEHFKGSSMEDLEIELFHLKNFGSTIGPINMIQAEIERREKEANANSSV